MARAGVAVVTDERERGGRHKRIARPWPKLFQNMRSSRETDLAAVFPIHVVCAWLGNSPAVARKHYLQVTDADFEKGSGKITDRADRRAAISVQKHPKTSKHSGAKVQEKAGNRAEETPATGVDPRAELLANLQEQAETLTKALTTAHEVAVRTRVSDLANLERAIASARGRK